MSNGTQQLTYESNQDLSADTWYHIAAHQLLPEIDAAPQNIVQSINVINYRIVSLNV